MQLAKFGHSCVRLSEAGRTLVIDPGVFSEASDALAGIDTVLITHEHPDHVDIGALTAAAEANADLRIWAPESVAQMLPALSDVVTTVGAGEEFDASGFGVRTFGGQHALIHSSVPVVANVGYLIDETVYHPGDSFTVPTAPVDTALVPIHAPWSRVGEVLDFEIALRARQAFQIHDALLNDDGKGVVYGHIRRIAGEYGTDFRVLDTGETVDVSG
ncbi:MBL fold metallo-hydrolase [Solicola gregarius]|uniref:MBL fold metallo-hydrolase n=1 Tax=Solicola gregarius TaxID=2908642 RepID=A0AA46TGT0_9ACTN|nr:MBL fold metallo-hydrolase [Solicola gregarius]UYM04990.1 MBL fold metallo-hydrolase [Solicola gregarius]